jgi:hypothetical protein
MMHDVKTRIASWKTDSIARSSWSWVQIAHQHALCPEIQVAFYPDVLPLHIVSPASHRPSPVSTSFSTFTFQNPSCLLSSPTTCLQAQFILCLILALQLRLSICHALIAMSPYFYPFTSFTLRLPLIFTSECVPFKPRKKISVFYLLCSPNYSRLRTVSLSYLCVPSLCFPDGYLSYLDVHDIFTAFPEYTKYQKEDSYL